MKRGSIRKRTTVYRLLTTSGAGSYIRLPGADAGRRSGSKGGSMSDGADRLSRNAFLKAAGATAAAGTALGPLSGTARAAVRRTAATTELRVLMIAGQDKLWREIVKIWNASHDQKVKLSMSVDSNENIKTTYRTNLAGSNPPDMVFL